MISDSEEIKEDAGLICSCVCFCSFFILLCLFMIYRAKRPCLRVNGNEITVYPLWKRKKTISINDITSRKAESYQDNSFVMFGAVGYALSRGNRTHLLKMNSMTEEVENDE